MSLPTWLQPAAHPVPKPRPSAAAFAGPGSRKMTFKLREARHDRIVALVGTERVMLAAEIVERIGANVCRDTVYADLRFLTAAGRLVQPRRGVYEVPR